LKKGSEFVQHEGQGSLISTLLIIVDYSVSFFSILFLLGGSALIAISYLLFLVEEEAYEEIEEEAPKDETEIQVVR